MRRALLLLLWAGCAGLSSAAEPLQVLHWWTSVSERRAAAQLAQAARAAGLGWQDATVPGGAGTGAGKVLRARVLASNAPDVAQLVGVSLTEAASMGLLLELAAPGGDPGTQALFPTVQRLVSYRGHAVAVPLGVHRINTLVWNQALFARLGLAPPLTPQAFDAAARRLQAAGIVPLAQSREPWQLATLFESLLLAEGGAELHQALFVSRRPEAAADPRLARALARLRALKRWMGEDGRGPPEEPWPTTLARLREGRAAMMVMGDWTVGELRQSGWRDGEEFGCSAAPGTAAWHLYSVDSLAFFARDFDRADAQQRLAHLLAQPAVQQAYHRHKGAAPVRRDAEVSTLPLCTRAAWLDFAHLESSGSAPSLVPSLVHRMATDETSKDAFIAEIARFFGDDAGSTAQSQQRLAALTRALPRGEARP